MSKSPDIVERLRYGTMQRNHGSLIELCTEAAAEIERLHDELAMRLRDTEGLRMDLQKVPQNYQDEIVAYLDEIGRLRKTAIETMHEMLRRANEIERLDTENEKLKKYIKNAKDQA